MSTMIDSMQMIGVGVASVRTPPSALVLQDAPVVQVTHSTPTMQDVLAASTELALTHRERELGAIIVAYNQVTDQLKLSHEKLRDEVVRLREELTRKNRQLRRRERLAALGEMAAGVAHEIRNPLGGIALFASLLEKDLRDRPAELRLAGKIAKGVQTVESIVTDFLEFGRPRDPQPVVVKLDSVAREAADLAMSRAADPTLQIEIAEELGEIEIVSDPAMIKRALLNLLLNAVDAVSMKGAVDSQKTVEYRSSPLVRVGVKMKSLEQVTITVADNGPGVPAELMDRIFNPFFTTKDSGMGLGLAIVHQIAESLHGHVQVVNPPSGGAEFSISIPTRWTPGEDEV